MVVVSINPINNYQEPNLSINKSHNFMIWQGKEEKSVSNCYHACLIVALFFLSPPYTHSPGGRTVKMRVLGFVCYLHQHFLQGEKFPVVLLHTSHSHFFHSLILWVFSWSGHRYVGSRHFILYIGKLLLLLLFFPTLQSPLKYLFQYHFTTVFVSKTASIPYLLSTSDACLKSRLGSLWGRDCL